MLSSKSCKACFFPPIKVTLLESFGVEFIFLASNAFNIDSNFHVRIKLILLFMYTDKFLRVQINTDESSCYKMKIVHWHQVFLFLCSHMLQLVLCFFFLLMLYAEASWLSTVKTALRKLQAP